MKGFFLAGCGVMGKVAWKEGPKGDGREDRPPFRPPLGVAGTFYGGVDPYSMAKGSRINNLNKLDIECILYS